MPVSQRPIAVLLMAMGGPDSLENVEPFLLDVRGVVPLRLNLSKRSGSGIVQRAGNLQPLGSPRIWQRNSSNV